MVGVGIFKKRGHFAGVDLADGFADDLQGQAVATIAVDQAAPGLCITEQLFFGRQRPSLSHAEAVQLELPCSTQ